MPVVFQKYHTQFEQEVASRYYIFFSFSTDGSLTSGLVVFVPYEPMHIILPVSIKLSI